MSKKLATLRTEVRQILRDEYVSGTSLEFNDGELDQAILKAVVDVSEVSPYLTKETLTTTADSKELDISTIRDDLLFISHVEYKISQNPQQFRNISLMQDTLTMDINWDPAASESVYLYCGKVHTLNEGESTLWPQHERAILDGAAGYAAQNWLNKARTDITEATTAIDLVNSAVDEVAARMALVITDINSGRTAIVASKTALEVAIDAIADRITAAVGDLTTGRTYMGAGASSKLATAITEMEEANTALDLAVTDIGTYRTAVAANITEEANSIGEIDAQIVLAMADIASARLLVADITPARTVSNYTQTATAELNNAQAKLLEARAFMSKGDANRGAASASIANASGFMTEAMRLLQTSPAPAYGTYSARELQNVSALLAEARGHLQYDSTIESNWLSVATREMSAAQAFLSKSRGYANEASLRLQSARAMAPYINWANNKLAEFRMALGKMSAPRNFKEYPRD